MSNHGTNLLFTQSTLPKSQLELGRELKALQALHDVGNVLSEARKQVEYLFLAIVAESIAACAIASLIRWDVTPRSA
jgi:hypothetical protein